MKKKVKKEDIEAYSNTFLTPCRIPGGGRQVRISDKSARQISMIVRLAGVDSATIGGFVENVIKDHLSDYDEVIKAMLTNPPVLRIPRQ